MITKCKKGFARPDKDDRNNEPNKYICEGGYTGWVNARMSANLLNRLHVQH